MKRNIKAASLILIICIIATLCACSKNVSSDTSYPQKAITMYVPFAAGGGTDLACRVIAADAKDMFGVNVNVVNKEGAGGTICLSEFKDYANDGYNLVFSSCAVLTTQPILRDVEYSLDDFEFVCGTSVKSAALIIPTSAGVNNIDDWIDYLNRNNIDVNIGLASAAGSLLDYGSQLLFPMLQEQAGLKNYNIVYYSDGTTPTIAALLNGEVDAIISYPYEVAPYIASGEFTAVGVAGKERLESYPDYPTFIEQGYDFTNIQLEGIIAPAGLSPEIKTYLMEKFEEVFKNGLNLKNYAESSGYQAHFTSGEEFETNVRNQAETFNAAFGK